MFRLYRIFIKVLALALNKRVWLARWLGVRVGENTRIYIDDWPSEPFLIEIGKNCTITSGCVFITHDGSGSLVVDKHGRYQRYGRIVVSDNVFIGCNSIVLPNVFICEKVVIGAGTVVNKDLTVPGVYVGNPAKLVKPFDVFSDDFMRSGVSGINKEDFESYEDYVLICIDEQKNK